MNELTLYQWLTLVLFTIAIVIALLAWLIPKRDRKDSDRREVIKFRSYSLEEFPKIHSTNGVPTLRQLMEGRDADPEMLGIAEGLYETGLAQFNHYVNNRDGVIKTSREQMADLAKHISRSEVILAESIGASMASVEDDEQRKMLKAQYDDLAPQARIYVQHKRREIKALIRIARDLEKNVPRTDYTSVKARIASGIVTLDAVMGELPVFWQDIISLNERAERPDLKGKPPKRKFLHVRFMLQDGGLLEDTHAEKDDEWIISHKHDLMVPYQEPIPIYEQMEEGNRPVQKGEIVVINKNPSSEWDTKFWRQGGRLDQEHLRVKNGTSPEQLWRAYRRRVIRKIGWIIAIGLTLIGAAIIVAVYL